MFILAGIRRNFQIFIFLCFFFVLVLNRSELSQWRLPGGGREAIHSPKPHPHPRLGSPQWHSVCWAGTSQCPASWVEGSVLTHWGWQGDCLGRGAPNVAAAPLSPSCS